MATKTLVGLKCVTYNVKQSDSITQPVIGIRPKSKCVYVVLHRP